MKTSIIITGSGQNSKSTLKRACETSFSETKALQFHCYEIKFATKKEAVRALSAAYRHLHSDIEDWNASSASYKYGVSLSYDAANACLTV